MEQTFILPVNELIEALSKAGRLAVDKSLGGRLITLEVTYLALDVRIKHASKGYVSSIAWLDLSQSREPFSIIEYHIEKGIKIIQSDWTKNSDEFKKRVQRINNIEEYRR